MTKRKRLLLFVVMPAASVAVVALAVWQFWLGPGITPENAAKIQKGMTADEVERILGGPPRDEATDTLEVTRDPPNARARGTVEREALEIELGGSRRSSAAWRIRCRTADTSSAYRRSAASAGHEPNPEGRSARWRAITPSGP